MRVQKLPGEGYFTSSLTHQEAKNPESLKGEHPDRLNNSLALQTRRAFHARPNDSCVANIDVNFRETSCRLTLIQYLREIGRNNPRFQGNRRSNVWKVHASLSRGNSQTLRGWAAVAVHNRELCFVWKLKKKNYFWVFCEIFRF